MKTPYLTEHNINDDYLDVEEINISDEIQQKKEAEIEIIFTMMEKGYIANFNSDVPLRNI